MRRLPVTILAATGIVGQRFVQMLDEHPWFEIKALVASRASAGKAYRHACSWKLDAPMPASIGGMAIKSLGEDLPGELVFSALPGRIARKAEAELARAGHIVCSNASAYRLESDVPLLIPEINPDHLALISRQRREREWPGFIVTSPNCTTTAIALPLKPLDDAFGLEKVIATSMQAASGAGYPGVSSLDLLDNVVPFIAGEEEKIETETRALLGSLNSGDRVPSPVEIGAHANRVPVIDGHLVCLSIELQRRASGDEAVEILRAFRGNTNADTLPSAPPVPLLVAEAQDRPQPRLDRYLNDGMSVVLGRVRSCPSLDLRMVSLVHNTLRGAAGGAILNAELLYQRGYLE